MNFEKQIQNRMENNQQALGHAYLDLAFIVRPPGKSPLPLEHEDPPFFMLSIALRSRTGSTAFMPLTLLHPFYIQS